MDYKEYVWSVMSVTEERFGRIETMLANLIRIVGNTNAMVEETRDDLRALDAKVTKLEDKIDRLESKVVALEDKVDSLQEEIGYIRTNMATREDIQQINWRLDVHMEKLARQ